MNTIPSASRSCGSAVVLEPESRWPASAFAANADCDRVVIMRVDPNLTASRLVERIATQSAEFERLGAKLRSVILACARCDRQSNAYRMQLARALLPLLTSGEGRLVLTIAPNEETSTDVLRELADNLSRELHERSITFLANDTEIVTPVPSARKHSGIFRIDPMAYGDPAPNTWLHNAESQHFVSEAM